ncbi:uncharacterized protein LOC110825795 isoform X2 [Carica papaya]|uniref:uncharacterized protein LOC110825795 isoform X2 n=1 Tax=Carica papaya TaxID=3649 RepID=UPI000B8CD317|nr:uncharacterized protein LOC110825795 isoform X2 [Carica papaya]
MSVFYHEEPPQQAKRCKSLSTALKDVFSHCQIFNGKVSNPGAKEEYAASDFDDEQEVVVSAIRIGAMEKLRRKPSLLRDGFSWVLSSSSGELYIYPNSKEVKQMEEWETEEFLSVDSCFSRCSSCLSRETFVSVKTNFPVCVSSDRDLRKRMSIIQELCHCEGWPFGLCRKALLLPPLPKSPSESWLWRKPPATAKMSFIYYNSFK